MQCKSCHTPASHTGATFASWWDRKPLSELFQFVTTRMPKNEPGSLQPDDRIVTIDVLRWIRLGIPEPLCIGERGGEAVDGFHGGAGIGRDVHDWPAGLSMMRLGTRTIGSYGVCDGKQAKDGEDESVHVPGSLSGRG